MKENLTSSPAAADNQNSGAAADQIRPAQIETTAPAQTAPETGTATAQDNANGAETAENAVSRPAGRDEATTPNNETGTAQPAPKARKTRKAKDARTKTEPEPLTEKPVSDWTTEDGVKAIRDFMGVLPDRFVKAYLKAETGAASKKENSEPETGKPEQGHGTQGRAGEPEPRQEITDPLKAVYLAVVQAYIEDAVYNLRTADQDFNPKAAREIYSTEITIGNLLMGHLDLTPREMTDVLPNQTDLPIEERIPDINADRTLFFMDHLHRILFRRGEKNQSLRTDD